MNQNSLIYADDEQKFFENYKKRITRDVIKTLYKNYKVYDCDNVLMDIETLQKEILTPKTIKRCIGATNTTPISQCSRNAIENYDYCKTHLYKICLNSQESTCKKNLPIEFNINSSNDNSISQEKCNLKKKFIDDSFYFIDNKFIYDTKNHIKVGYIHNNEYILTSDPFLLDMI
jgi:hypothetical protein